MSKEASIEQLTDLSRCHELIDWVMQHRGEPDPDVASRDGFYSWGGTLENMRLETQNQAEPRLDGSPSWGSAHGLYVGERVKPLLEARGISSPTIVEIGLDPSARLIRNWVEHFPDAQILGIDLDSSKVQAARKTLEEGGYDLGRINIIEAEASQELSRMAGKADIVCAQNLLQHLSDRRADSLPSPFERIVKGIENVLKPDGVAVVSDLLLAGPESWQIIPKAGFENNPELPEIMALHRLYLGTEQRPGILYFGWLARGGHVWRSGEEIAAEFGKYTTNLHPLYGSNQDYSAGYTTGRDNNPCSVIGACVPPTVALGVERAKLGLERALGSPNLPEPQRQQLSSRLEQLKRAADFCWQVGKEYLERVYYNPKLIVSMPGISFQMWQKAPEQEI